MNIWNIRVITVVWNKPANNPIPLDKDFINKLNTASNEELSKTIIATLLKRIDLSRLKVTAFDSNKNNIEYINTEEVKESNFYLISLKEIVVLPIKPTSYSLAHLNYHIYLLVQNM
jgi:hypothetical protein